MEAYERHIKELRKRLLYSLIVLTAATLGVFNYSSEILSFLRADLGFELYALQAYEVFYTQLMLSILLGVLISLPIIFYQILKFVQPGLKEREYKIFRNYLPFSALLFFAGFTFAYQVVVKNSLKFFASFNDAASVGAVWGLRDTIGFTVQISAYTGIFFQIPIVAAVLAKAGILESGMMKEYRSHFIIIILILAAVATPPDIFTQVAITLPVIGLYQGSIYLVERINK